MMKKLSYKDYNKRITTLNNDNVQSHDKKESKSNSTSSANSGTCTLTHDQIIKKNCRISCDSYSFNTRCDYMIQTEIYLV